MNKKSLSPSIDDVTLKQLEEFICAHQQAFENLSPQEAIEYLLTKIRDFKLQTDERFECELIEKEDGFSFRISIKKTASSEENQE